jgi:hypothetical protein
MLVKGFAGEMASEMCSVDNEHLFEGRPQARHQWEFYYIMHFTGPYSLTTSTVSETVLQNV